MTEPSTDPSEIVIDTNELYQLLHHSFDVTTHTKARLENKDFPVQPGSPLSGDDRGVPGFKLSARAEQAIGGATDHLDALRTLVLDAQVLHIAAPYTLLRAAIEHASIAVWLMAPRLRKDRQERRLRDAYSDAVNREEVLGTIGYSDNHRANEKAKMDALIVSLGLSPSTLSTLRTSAIVTAADQEVGQRADIDAAWRISAGFSHGKSYPYLLLSERQTTLSKSEPDITNVTISMNLKALTWVTGAARVALQTAVGLLDQRRVCVADQM